MEGISEKVVVFAGAGGIATATAEYIGKGGGKVVIGDAVQGAAEHAVAACSEAGGEGVATTVDISDKSEVNALIDLAISTYGRIDGLFNVAANLAPEEVVADSNIVDIDLDVWKRNIDINLTGYMLTCRYAIPHMIDAGGGSIVNTISDAVYGGMEVNVAYQATKAGISAMNRHIARAYGKSGIRANCVSPGMVMTERNKRDVPAEFLDGLLANTPSFRHGEPGDLGATVAFLLSDMSQWITGQIFNVDGGVVMRA